MLKNRAAQEIEDAVVAVAIEQPADQVRVANELRSRGLTVSPRRVYDILFKAAAEMIRVIAADPKHLGGETGMIDILHTWGRPSRITTNQRETKGASQGPAVIEVCAWATRS